MINPKKLSNYISNRNKNLISDMEKKGLIKEEDKKSFYKNKNDNTNNNIKSIEMMNDDIEEKLKNQTKKSFYKKEDTSNLNNNSNSPLINGESEEDYLKRMLELNDELTKNKGKSIQ